MKNKGFTLVELLAVIVILGILMTLAIPSVLKISSNVKEKSYKTKIEIIENAAVTYGESNSVSKLKKCNNSTYASSCNMWVSFDADGELQTASDGKSYFTSQSAGGTYPAEVVAIESLVTTKNLSYDDDENKVVVDPVTSKSINECNVYIYYRNNRVYAKFDRTACDKVEKEVS